MPWVRQMLRRYGMSVDSGSDVSMEQAGSSHGCDGCCNVQVQQELHRGGPTEPDLSTGPTRMSTMLQQLPHALYAEEVLMYHRATSRLIEMCSRP
jgi:hypothetical protein